MDADITPVDAAAAGQRLCHRARRGLILFDTGQDRASVTDDTYFPMPDLVILPAHDPTAAARLLGT